LLNKTFLSDYHYFPDIYVSQGSVATRTGCGGFFNDHFITHLLQSDGERILKIGQHMAKVMFVYIQVQLKGSVKEPNISIYFFFRPSLNGVLFPMFCLLVGWESRFSVLKDY